MLKLVKKRLKKKNEILENDIIDNYIPIEDEKNVNERFVIVYLIHPGKIIGKLGNQVWNKNN